MFKIKSKWQKRYEKAMEHVEFWRDYHAEQSNVHRDDLQLCMIHTAQKIAMQDTLNDMKNIIKLQTKYL